MAFQASALAHAAPLSMSEVLDSVRARYPLVEAARQDFQAARGEVVSSRGAFDLQLKSRAVWDIESYYPSQTLDAVLEQPTPIWGLSFFGGYRYGRGSFPVYDGKLQTLNPGELRGGVVVPLLRDGPTDSRRVRIQRAEIGVSIAEAGLDQQFVESVRTARQRYWEWVAAGAKLKIAKKLLEIAETRDSQLSVQLKKGDASVFDRNDNLRGVLQRRSQLASAERQLQRAELELSLFVRDSKGQPVIVDRSRLPDGFPAVSTTDPSDEAAIQQKVELAVRQRPDLRRIQGQREQNDRELSLARNQFLPRLDFSLGVSRDLGNGSPSLSQTETEAAVMLEFPFPLRSARGRKDVAVATDLRLSAQQGLLADRIVTEIRDAESALRQSRERLQLANEELELALVLEKGERARFAHGDSNLIFVQLREQTTADAANRKVDADLDYQVAQAALDAAQGLPSLKNP
ncbi:MAG: TolC family protein [Oligoflexia bacterium]